MVHGELRAQAFVLSRNLEDPEVIGLSEFAIHQVPLRDAEPRTESARVARSMADIAW